ncbi:MAG: glutamate-cysteine ligase family protein [Actinomycetes bacterium]
MPTRDPAQRLRRDDVERVVADVVLPAAGTCEGRAVGLEVELVPVRVHADGRTSRVPLGHVDDPASVLGLVASMRGDADDVLAPGATVSAAGIPLTAGGRLTFEPGAQVEVSGACAADAATALEDLVLPLDALALAAARSGVALCSVGLDVWHDVEQVPQQLTAPRYPAMATYLATRSPEGARMMRGTASLQVNVDPGAGAVLAARWRLANLLAPLLTATFAHSPVGGRPGRPGAVSGRARAWQRLDPTRTGVPAGVRQGSEDLVGTMVGAALDADVLLVADGAGGATPGRPGWRFGTWLDEGDGQHGWPTEPDLRGHLTTLFHEVRPRGALEIRALDAVPAPWRPVPVTLLAGVLYDDVARDRVRELLEPHAPALPSLLARAATAGLHDPALCALAVEAWSFALDGARRLPEVTPDMVDVAEAFVDRFTLRGRAPADELAERLAVDPLDALRSVSEPVVAGGRHPVGVAT